MVTKEISFLQGSDDWMLKKWMANYSFATVFFLLFTIKAKKGRRIRRKQRWNGATNWYGRAWHGSMVALAKIACKQKKRWKMACLFMAFFAEEAIF